MKTLYLIVLLCSLCSCTGRHLSRYPELAAADSLMMTDPQGALGILSGIDSAEIGRMDREERAFHTLLMTEAEYKNYLPVAEDTAVSEAVSYYRRRGPEELLARALVMQGAVLSERGDAEGAMLAYKEAEPLVERMGDMEQLGLLHTRIASLYRSSFVNEPEAILRYRKALECFEKAEQPERIMSAHLSLSRILMIDSVDKAIPHLEKALSMAEQYDNRLCGLSAFDLLCYVYEPDDDARKILDLIKRAFSRYGETPQNIAEESLYNDFQYLTTKCYVGLKIADSARFYCESIKAYSQTDSLLIYSLFKDIAELENNNDDILINQSHAHRIELALLGEGYESQLRDSELRYDHSRLEAELYRRDRSILLLTVIFLLSGAAVAAVIFLLRTMLRRQRAEARRFKALADIRGKELDRQTAESNSLREEKIHEEEARKSMEQMFRRYAAANSGLMRFYNLTYSTMRKIIDIYDIHQSNPAHLLDKSVDVARDFIRGINTYGDASTLIDTVYPGFLSGLFSEYPGLSKDERYLIILTCLGYPASTLCTILDISETNLSTRKTRLARKMGLDGSLAKYLSSRLAAWGKR
jgi:tetratricopeptide (TPR) repeat protein/DNA-binding CsgD family transcriptional regulator